MTNMNNYLTHLQAFRGFAILNVIGAHAWSFMIFWTGSLSSESIKVLFWLTETVFHGSTLYFAIISGLLFSRILKARGWTTFFYNKATNVFLPYMVITAFITGLYWQYAIQDPLINNTIADYFLVTLKNIVTGKGSIHFWYIPVLLVMFLVTPIMAWSQRHATYIVWLLVLAPLVISRSPFPDFLKPQSFVYFVGAYAVGMLLGQHYDVFRERVGTYKNLLIAVVLVTSAALLMLYAYEYKPDGFYSVRQTLVYIQKLAICALILFWFTQIETKLPSWLSTLGNYAFSIFFLHVLFIDLAIRFTSSVLKEQRTVELIALFGSINLLAGIIGSILVAYIVKKLLGRHSRKLVGV